MDDFKWKGLLSSTLQLLVRRSYGEERSSEQTEAGLSGIKSGLHILLVMSFWASCLLSLTRFSYQ